MGKSQGFLPLLILLPALSLPLGCPGNQPAGPAGPTPTATSTISHTPTITFTSTSTFTRTQTPPPTNTPTRTSTRTVTRTPTITLTPTPTANIQVHIVRIWDDYHSLTFQLNGTSTAAGAATLKSGGVNYPMTCGAASTVTNCSLFGPVFTPGVPVTLEITVPYKVAYLYGVQPGGIGFAPNGSAVSWLSSGNRQNFIETCIMPTPGYCIGGNTYWTGPSYPATYVPIPVATAYPTPSSSPAVPYGLKATIESFMIPVQATPMATLTIRDSGHILIP